MMVERDPHAAGLGVERDRQTFVGLGVEKDSQTAGSGVEKNRQTADCEEVRFVQLGRETLDRKESQSQERETGVTDLRRGVGSCWIRLKLLAQRTDV